MSARVLVVDDEPSVRMTLAANLELEGYEVAEATCGEEALRLIAATPFDLVLSDIKMPGLNGVDLFLEIKALRPGLPVILMSAFAVEHLISRAIQEGVFTVVTKPFAVDALAALMASAVRAPIVLVVDDAEHDATATTKALCDKGIRARAAFNGLAAIELVRGGNVDVCVLDLVMTGVSGPEVARRILEIDSTIAVIAVSGCTGTDDLLGAASTNGARAFVRKPIETRELMRTIAAVRREAK